MLQIPDFYIVSEFRKSALISVHQYVLGLTTELDLCLVLRANWLRTAGKSHEPENQKLKIEATDGRTSEKSGFGLFMGFAANKNPTSEEAIVSSVPFCSSDIKTSNTTVPIFLLSFIEFSFFYQQSSRLKATESNPLRNDGLQERTCV